MPYGKLYEKLGLLPIVTFEAKSIDMNEVTHRCKYTLCEGFDEFYNGVYEYVKQFFYCNTLDDWNVFVERTKKENPKAIDDEGYIDFGGRLFLRNPKISYSKISPFKLLKLIALLNGQTVDELYSDTINKSTFMPKEDVLNILQGC
jgi:hypothetical protein